MAKIYNEIIIDMNPESSTFEETIYEDSYDYEGDMILAQGGSLAGLLRGSAMKWAAKDIQEKERKQKKKAGFLSGLVSLLKPVAGIASKGLMTALGIGSGGLLSPLLMGFGTAGISKIFSGIGKTIGLGADPSKIKATGKYGYGKDLAKTIREGLEEDIKSQDPFSKEGILGDIAMSYISAVTPKIVPKKGGGWGIEGGELAKAQKGKGFKDLLSAERLFDMQEEGLIPDLQKAILQKKRSRLQVGKGLVPSLGDSTGVGTGKLPIGKGGIPDLESLYMDELSKDATEGILDQDVYKAMADQIIPIEEGGIRGQSQWDILKSSDPSISKVDVPEVTGFNLETPKLTKGERAAYDEVNKMRAAGYDVGPGGILPEEFGKGFIDYDTGEIRRQPPMPKVPIAEAFSEGFDISDDYDLLDYGGIEGFDESSWEEGRNLLERLNAEQIREMESRSRYYKEGGKVPEYKGGGTVSDYLGMKGKTLGGSNKQSLAEMLGRK